jgi:hypothetical protein
VPPEKEHNPLPLTGQVQIQFQAEAPLKILFQARPEQILFQAPPKQILFQAPPDQILRQAPPDQISFQAPPEVEILSQEEAAPAVRGLLWTAEAIHFKAAAPEQIIIQAAAFSILFEAPAQDQIIFKAAAAIHFEAAPLLQAPEVCFVEALRVKIQFKEAASVSIPGWQQAGQPAGYRHRRAGRQAGHPRGVRGSRGGERWRAGRGADLAAGAGDGGRRGEWIGPVERPGKYGHAR